MKNGLLILLTIISFTLSGQGIYLDKLQVPPSLTLTKNILTFNGNKDEFYSKKLKIKVNKNKKEIYFIASSVRTSKILQTSDYKFTLSFNLDKYNVKDPTNYRFYWLDPDKKARVLNVRNTEKIFHSNTIFPFREADEWFYVDSNFNKLDDENYDFVYPFYFNYSIVKIKDKYALINKALELITQPIFDTIRFQNDPLRSQQFIVQKGGKSFEIDTNGQVYYNDSHGIGCRFSNGGISNFHTYKSNGKLGLEIYNETGRESKLLPPIYDHLTAYTNDFALVRLSDKYGIIDPNGEVLLPIIYDEIRMDNSTPWEYNYKEVVVCINGKCGFADKSWEISIDLKYLDAQPFNLGFALVKTTDGKWGYIDKKGKEYWR